jgi:hypothetical protein
MNKFLVLLTKKRTIFFLSLAVAIALGEYVIDFVWGDGDGFVSHPLLRIISSILFYASIVLAALVFPLEYEKQWERLCEKIKKFREQPLRAEYSAIFRILFASLALKLICSAYDVFEVSAYNLTASEIDLLRHLFWIEIGALVLIIFGIGGRIPYVVNLILGGMYLHGDVGTDLFYHASFWMIFMGTDQVWAIRYNLQNKWLNLILNLRPVSLKWPVIFLGISVAYTISSAGVSKILDGVWIEGTGFYYTFMQPWLRVQGIESFLNWDWLMVLMNWLTIISELIVLPLLLFRRTRFAGGLAMIFMFVLLTWPFRIDAIGPFGFAIGLIAMLASDRFNEWRIPFFRNKQPEPQTNTLFPLAGFYLLNSLLPILLAFWLFFSIYFDFMQTVASGRINYPLAAYPFKRVVNNETIAAPDIFRLPVLNRLSPEKWITAMNNRSMKKVSPKWFAPFNYWHFLCRGYYRMQLVQKDGTVIEPFPVFTESGAFNGLEFSGGFMQERVIENRNWLLTIAAHKLSVKHDLNVFTESEQKQIRALLVFFDRKFSESGYRDYSIRVQLRYLVVPPEMQGDQEPWMKEPWMNLFDYHPITKELLLLEQPKPFPIETLGQSIFKKGKVKLQPVQD